MLPFCQSEKGVREDNIVGALKTMDNHIMVCLSYTGPISIAFLTIPCIHVVAQKPICTVQATGQRLKPSSIKVTTFTLFEWISFLRLLGSFLLDTNNCFIHSQLVLYYKLLVACLASSTNAGL